MRWESMVAKITDSRTIQHESRNGERRFRLVRNSRRAVENLQCWSSSLQFLYCKKSRSYKYMINTVNICTEFRLVFALIVKYQIYLIVKTKTSNYILICFWFSFLRNWLSKIINFDYLNCIESSLKNKSCCLRKEKLERISIIYYYLWQLIIINANLMLICLEIIAPISLCRLV